MKLFFHRTSLGSSVTRNNCGKCWFKPKLRGVGIWKSERGRIEKPSWGCGCTLGSSFSRVSSSISAIAFGPFCSWWSPANVFMFLRRKGRERESLIHVLIPPWTKQNYQYLWDWIKYKFSRDQCRIEPLKRSELYSPRRETEHPTRLRLLRKWQWGDSCSSETPPSSWQAAHVRVFHRRTFTFQANQRTGEGKKNSEQNLDPARQGITYQNLTNRNLPLL